MKLIVITAIGKSDKIEIVKVEDRFCKENDAYMVPEGVVFQPSEQEARDQIAQLNKNNQELNRKISRINTLVKELIDLTCPELSDILNKSGDEE